MPTAARILQLAPTACYLAANDVNQKTLSGKGSLVPSQAIKIYNVYKILKHIYDLDPNYAGMQSRCNYLWELMKRWALKAAAIVDGGGGGSVAPVTPSSGTLVNPLDWEVGASSSQTAPLADGESTVTLDGTSGMVDFRGFNINFIRGNLTQYTTPPPDGISTYYSWNRTTGVFTLLNGAAVLGEQFRIEPYT